MDNNSSTNQLMDDMIKVTELARKSHLKVVSKPVHMIKGDGTFCESNVEKFVESATNILAPGEFYAIISIIGPQSSGKSFLLNQLFGTNFDVMNATKGRSQTTNGILLGQSQSSKSCALIMDVEGSDGRERGDNDVSFERQSALFALTMSDIMMINMLLTDIGRQQGGSVPLLRTVFQERVKLDQGKTKVLVVVRDYYKEPPFEMLKQDILTTMEKIWKSAHDRPDGIAVQFSDYIEVMVVALPHKAHKLEFEEEVTKLREWFAKENIVGLRQDKNSTSGFSFSAKNIWKAIKQNKQLDLPNHHVEVSTYVCEKFGKECLAAAIRDKDFERLNDAASSDEFIEKLEALLQNSVTRYDKDTEMSDETQRDAKRDVLKEKIMQSAEPFVKKLLDKTRSEFFYEEKEKVTAEIKKADDPAMEAPTIVEKFLKLFTRSCEGFGSKYVLLRLESRDMLRAELGYHAKAITLHIKEQRMKEEVKLAKAEIERMKNEAEFERIKNEAEFERMKNEAEVERMKNEAEFERMKNEAEVERMKNEAEFERMKRVERMKNEAEFERMKNEAEVERMKIERMKVEAEVERMKNDERMKNEAEVERIKNERMKVEAEVERMKNEAVEMLQMKLKELELAIEEAARAEKNAEAAREEAVRTARDIKEKADAAAEYSKSQRSSYISRIMNFVGSVSALIGIPELLESIPGAVESIPGGLRKVIGLTE